MILFDDLQDFGGRIYFYDLDSAPVTGNEPVLLSVGTSETFASNATSVAFTGTNLGADETERTLYLVQGAEEVEQTQGVGDDTSGIFDVVGFGLGGTLKYGVSTSLKVVTSEGDYSLPVTVNPPSGYAYVDLASVHGVEDERITAIPDLEPGDQLEYETVGGKVEVHDDATFTVADETVTEFDVRAFDGEWGEWAVQRVLIPADLAVGGSQHGHYANAVSLTQASTLLASGAVHGHAADGVSLIQAGALAVHGTAHGHYVSGVTLPQAAALTVGGSAHAQATGAVALIENSVLSVEGSVHAHSVGGVALTQSYLLQVAEAAHVHVSQAIGLSQSTLVAVSDVVHAHAADSPSVSAADFLSVAGSGHGQASDSPELVQASILTIGGAVHSLVSAEVKVGPATLLQVADVIHAQTAEGVELSHGLLLGVATAVHLHAAEAIDLAQATTVVVSGSLHAHIAQQINLMMPGGPVIPPSRTIVVLAQSRVIVIQP